MGRKYRTPKFKEGFAFIYMSIDRLQREKTKKGNNLSNASLYVQGNRQMSNFIMQDVEIILHHAKLVGVAI